MQKLQQPEMGHERAIQVVLTSFGAYWVIYYNDNAKTSERERPSTFRPSPFTGPAKATPRGPPTEVHKGRTNAISGVSNS